MAVVGPTLPFRGGIAQYNTRLRRAFERRSDIRFFSFSRQYPKWLYPGANDRDPDAHGHREPGVDYTIDSINPLTWWRTMRTIRRLAPALVVFHWWTFFWAPCFMAMIHWLKRRNIRVALICHNLADHDARGFKAALSRRVIDMADAYLVHSRAQADELARRHPGHQVECHPIPLYGQYPAASGRLPRRGRLELLFFGFIRPYKGLDVLLDALAELQDPDVYLTVVGEHWGDASALVARCAGNPNIELHLHYMSDAEAAEYFHRADFVVLPYTSATPSAVASLAFQYDTPVIASRVGGLVDVVVDGETGILVTPADAASLADALRSANRDLARQLISGIAGFKDLYTWQSLATALKRLA